MKHIILILYCLLCAPLFAQIGPAPVNSTNTWRVEQVYNTGQLVIRNGTIYQSLIDNNIAFDPAGSPSQWTITVGSGGSAPTGTAGGALSGTYPNPSLSATQPIKAASVNNIYNVDGFTTAGYPGIGVAQTAWSSGTYPLCTAVSSGGNNYLSVGVTTGVTPGTNPDVWWPVQNANTPTKLDCAFYYALGQADVGGVAVALQFGNTNSFSTPYITNIGLLEPNSAFHVNLKGAGRGVNGGPTEIKAGGSFVILSSPDKSAPSLPYNFEVSNIAFYGNNVSLGCMQIFGEKVGVIEHIYCTGWNPTSAFAIPIIIGDGASPFQNGGYQFILDDIFVQGNGNAPASQAVVTVTQSGGVPSFNVVSGGSYINQPAKVSFWGFGTGTAPCTGVGTLTPTFSGTGPYVLTGITPSGYSGCTGTMFAYVPDISAGAYGIQLSLMTDSTFKDLVVANAGWKYGIFYNGSSSNLMLHEHVYGGSDIQIEDNNENVHVGLECDSAVHICAEASASSGNAVFQGTALVQGGGIAQNPGVVGFRMPNGGSILQSTCGNNATSSNVFNLVLGPGGPIAHAGNYGAVNVINGEQCDTLTRDSSQGQTYLAGATLASPVITGTNSGLYKGYAVDTGTANAYAVALPDTAYTGATAGAFFFAKLVNASTASSTIAINGGTARALKIQNAGTTSTISVQANGIYLAVDDGTSIQLNPFSFLGGTEGVPAANLVFYDASTASKQFHFAASGITASNLRNYIMPDFTGSMQSNPSTTFSVTGCGTATALTGGGLVGQFTGGSATCTPVITTGITSAHGYSCSMQDQTTSTAAFRQTANTTTTVTFTAGGTVGATDVINFNCAVY